MRGGRSRPEVREVRDADGAPLARGETAARGGRVTISLPALSKTSRKNLLDAIAESLDGLD